MFHCDLLRIARLLIVVSGGHDAVSRQSMEHALPERQEAVPSGSSS
jgi:hypothetical protein